jgi:two-component system phosphate regulon sensor histidine kinase PhoR
LERIRSDFVANVSHELKTPITAIRGIAETLVDDPAMAGETRSRFLERIKEQTRRLSDLVVDLLTLARLESEEGHLPREPIDVRGPARAAARAVFPDRDELPVRFEESLPEAVMVLGDGEALEQAVGNLLSNAARYTPAGGIVRLRVVARDGMALVEIEDTGIGIDPVHQRRIFERFYRVDKARSRELGGTGLGLSIVKHVCRAHGGEVSVRSMPGSGSTFTMRIPLAGD